MVRTIIARSNNWTVVIRKVSQWSPLSLPTYLKSVDTNKQLDYFSIHKRCRKNQPIGTDFLRRLWYNIVINLVSNYYYWQLQGFNNFYSYIIVLWFSKNSTKMFYQIPLTFTTLALASGIRVTFRGTHFIIQCIWPLLFSSIFQKSLDSILLK